jgi:hypothetical protein
MKVYKSIFPLFLILSLVSCHDKDDNEPSKDPKELIKSVGVSLYYDNAMEDTFILFDDKDGDGNFEGTLGYDAIFITGTEVNVQIELSTFNTEIEQEKDNHLFCFSATNQIFTSFEYKDTDSKGKPFGFKTTWTTNDNPGTGEFKIVLQHQPGTKTGDCSSEAEKDFTISFPVEIIVP